MGPDVDLVIQHLLRVHRPLNELQIRETFTRVQLLPLYRILGTLCGIDLVPSCLKCGIRSPPYGELVVAPHLQLPTDVRLDWPTLQLHLFSSESTVSHLVSLDTRCARIRFVGLAFDAAVHAKRSPG